jgi:hypothetical protein
MVNKLRKLKKEILDIEDQLANIPIHIQMTSDLANEQCLRLNRRLDELYEQLDMYDDE